ncbi:MAG: hypothetical protein AB1801_10470 [Chloroflexota bacterium]
MARIDPELEQQLRAKPDETVDLIVRTRGDATPHLTWLASAGLRVKQQFKLTPGVAISGSGRKVLPLLDQDWVLSVELDAPVTTM